MDAQQVPTQPVPGDAPSPGPNRPPAPITDPVDPPPPLQDPNITDPMPDPNPPPMIA